MRESTWDAVGPMLLEAGYTMREAVVQLVAHAPTPATFAVGVAAIVESPLDAWAFAADRAASADLTALGERYGFSADETSLAVASLSVPTRAVESVESVEVSRDAETVGVGIEL